MQIRRASLDDAPTVHAIMLQAFAEYAWFTNPSSALNESVDDVVASMKRGGALVAERDNVAIASVRFHADDQLELLRLAVIPDERGNAVGVAMVREVEAIAKALGYASVRVYARSQQPDNRPWWTALGYVIDGYSGRYGIPDLRTHLIKEIR